MTTTTNYYFQTIFFNELVRVFKCHLPETLDAMEGSLTDYFVNTDSSIFQQKRKYILRNMTAWCLTLFFQIGLVMEKVS